MLSEDYEQAQYLSSQVEQARQRAVLAASDSGASRDDARLAEQQAREHAKKAGLVVVNVDQAVQEAKDAADRAEAPTDQMVATLAGNPVSLTRAAVDQATGDMITTDGSTTQAAGDARWVTQSGADILVAAEIERTGSETQVSGDNRWVTNVGADNTFSALFNAPNSAVRATADARYPKRGELTVNVADFGAKGDGTDETAKFQAAFDHVGALGGGEVFVPLPTFGQPYKVGKFYFPRNFRLRSAPGVVYRRAGLSWGGINRPFGNENSPLDNNTDPYSGHGNVEIIGGEWDGAYLDGGFLPGGFNCFMFIAARNILFQNVTVRDVVTNHAVDINGIDGMRIKGCRFLGFKDATTDQTRNYTEAIQIGPVADTVEGMGAWILHANGAASRNITIDDKCYFGPSGTPGTQAWPTGVGNHSAINRSRGLLTGGITITDCDFEGCTFMGVAVYTWDNVIIDKNRFSNCQIGIRANNFVQGRSWDPGLKDWVTAPLRENPSDLTIEKNTFTNTVDVDISVLGTGVSGVDGSWGWISDVLISGNTRRRTIAGRSTGQFIRALICKRITVEKNIGGWSSSGIALAGCEDQTVQANQIENTLGYGIIIDNTGGVAAMPAGNALVEANSVRNAGSHGIGINGVQGFSAVSNRVHNPARITNGAGILFSGSDSGLLSSNSVSATSTPFNINGLQGSNSTNTQVTFDNRIEGVTVRLASLTGAGTTYGNIQYV